MSELVQRHLESMAEEMEEMRRTTLYTEEETRSILKRRKEFEYKINGVTKHVQDFKDYIEFEKLLLKQIHCRRDKNKISERKGAIEYKIRRRIKTLYEIGLQRFSSDFPFWLSYFKFCKEFDHVGPAAQAVQSMIKHFSFKAEVWQIAANFYAYDRHEINVALEILHKGLSHHPKSEILYLEAIKLELLKVSGEDDSLDDDDMIEESTPHKICCAKIKTYLKSIIENINEFKFLIQILEILEKPTFTIEVQSFIIEHLISHHSQEDLVWHTLAQRELRDLHHSMRGETINYTSSTSFMFCVEKYREGLQKVASPNKPKLWSYYLDFLIGCQQDSQKVSNKKCVRLLKKALEEASNERCLTEKYYIVWLEFLSDEETPVVLEKAIAAIPSSVELWKLSLKFATFKNNKDQVNKIFKRSVYALGGKALPLWLMILRYSALVAGPETMDAIYRDGVKQPEEVSQVLKPKYIEWLALVRGIEDARRVYRELAPKAPYCKELHSVMSKMEATAATYDPAAWERVHQLACDQFGRDDADVWLKYVEFHLNFNKDNNLNDKVQRVYREAMNKLSPLLTFDFNEKFQNLLSEQ